MRRKKTNSKKQSALQKLPQITNFHKHLREFLGTGTNPHSKWGKFPPKNRYNEEQGATRVHIAQNQPGLEKRFCSLQACFRPVRDKQPKPTLIFRGQGQRISEIEKASWDNRVHVTFQKKAWADRPFSLGWCDDVFLPFIKQENEPGEESILFCDNLDAQIQPDFSEKLRSVNSFPDLLPAQCTESVQPVDGGLGRQVKFETGRQLEDWLEDDDNLEK